MNILALSITEIHNETQNKWYYYSLCSIGHDMYCSTSIIAIYGNNAIWHMVAKWKQVQHERWLELLCLAYLRTLGCGWMETFSESFYKVFATFLIVVHPFDSHVQGISLNACIRNKTVGWKVRNHFLKQINKCLIFFA